MKLEEKIIEVLKQEGGTPEGDQPYNMRGVQERIKASTDRVIIPPEVPNAEMKELLEGNSDVSKLIRKCMSTPGGIIYLSMMSNGDDNDPELMTPAGLLKKTKHPHYLMVFQIILRDLKVSFGEAHRARKVLEAWHIRKLSGYVAELWKKVKEGEDSFIRDAMKDLFLSIATTRRPELFDPKNQLTLINVSVITYLSDINGKLGDFLVQDPQFSLWEKVDCFLHEARPGTFGLSGKERIRKNIETGIEAGAKFAQGCMQVALVKTKNKKAAAQLFLDSAGKILSTPGMFGLDFIATVPALVEDKACLSAIIQIMKDRKYTRITAELDSAKVKHEKDFETGMKAGDDIQRLLNRLDFEHRYPYNPELFEIHNGTLRLCPWFIDFVRLVAVREKEAPHLRVVEKGCPMMHAKTSNAGGDNIVLMEDFARLYGKTLQAVWSKF